MSHYPIDEANPLMVKGWAVLRSDPWHLHGLYPSRVQADLARMILGSGYNVIYGSRRLATDDFIYANEDDEVAAMPETLTRWEKGGQFIEVEVANGENGMVLIPGTNVPWSELPIELREPIPAHAEARLLPFFNTMKLWAERRGFIATSSA